MKKIASVFVLALILFGSATGVFAAGQSMVKIGSDAKLAKDAAVNDVVVIDGNATISGKVENNIVVISGVLRLESGSYVGGQIVMIGGTIEKDSSAVIVGKITAVDMPSCIPFGLSFKNFFKGGWVVIWATISIMVLLGFLGLAILVAALIPEHINTVVAALERSFASMFLWGILWAFIAGLTLVLLAITIIGIILIPLAVILITLAWIVGYIASAIFVGKCAMTYFKKKAPPFVDAVLGIVLLFLATMVPVLGPIVIKPIFLFAGFGAVLTTRFGAKKRDMS
jgi:hypothetical protein